MIVCGLVQHEVHQEHIEVTTVSRFGTEGLRAGDICGIRRELKQVQGRELGKSEGEHC